MSICIPIVGPTPLEASQQIAQALLLGHVIELRLDRLQDRSYEAVRTLRQQCHLPVVFTLRKASHGGSYGGTEEERLHEIMQLAQLKPEYFDLEYDVSQSFVEAFKGQFPKVERIVSYHNFSETPPDLDGIIQDMHRIPGELYKIACTAHSTNDALRMLACIQSHAPLLGMCMGEWGQVSRILSPLCGSPWTFAALSETTQTAPGQITAQELQSIYALNRLTTRAMIYGLIGDPVTGSLSQFSHNRAMQALDIDNIYVKMRITEEELGSFFYYAKQLPLGGLSVTMPHKETVIPFLDTIDPQAKAIGAVNTLLIRSGKISGFNTDGIGALDAIEAHFSVKGKKVVILGAGGAARAIIYEAKRRGASVHVLNRTPEKASQLAQEFGVSGGGFQLLTPDYDVLINTTPVPLPIDPVHIRPGSLVMDIKALPRMSALLEHAQEKGCTLVYGYEMFVNQAIAQFELWFPKRFHKQELKSLLLSEILMRI